MAVQDFAPIINGVMWTQVALAGFFVGMRIYTRYFIIRSTGWDDIAMIVNLITFIAFVASISIGVTFGIGKKVAVIPPNDYHKAVMWEVIGQGVCIMGIAASKGSVALFLLRIVIYKWHKALLWFCVVSTTLLCAITTTLLFVQCSPTTFLWDHSIEGGMCWLNFTDVGLSMGAWSAAMDFVLAILPWHIIMGLNMKRKEKLTVAFGLSLGTFAGICSIIRTYQLQSLSSLSEYVYDTVPMLLWSTTEIMATVICACIPVLRPLYVKIIYGSRGDSSSGHPYPLQSRPFGKQGTLSGVASAASGVGGGKGIGSGSGVATKIFTGARIGTENASEESILRDQRASHSPGLPLQNLFGEIGGCARGSRGIMRTDEIVVETSSAV